MGCIVNGVGEMADADYGYIGSGPGKVSLFKNRDLVLKNIEGVITSYSIHYTKLYDWIVV